MIYTRLLQKLAIYIAKADQKSIEQMGWSNLVYWAKLWAIPGDLIVQQPMLQVKWLMRNSNWWQFSLVVFTNRLAYLRCKHHITSEIITI